MKPPQDKRILLLSVVIMFLIHISIPRLIFISKLGDYLDSNYSEFFSIVIFNLIVAINTGIYFLLFPQCYKNINFMMFKRYK